MVTYVEDTATAACVRHPFLGPDAWSSVRIKRPVGDGAKAALVCQFACPIRDRCPFIGVEGNEIIVSRGWYISNGSFITPPEGTLEIHQAAAFLGLRPEYLQELVRALRIQGIKGPAYLIFYQMDDLWKIAEHHGPKHGTAARYEVHLLRGEEPCARCVQARNLEAESAGLL